MNDEAWESSFVQSGEDVVRAASLGWEVCPYDLGRRQPARHQRPACRLRGNRAHVSQLRPQRDDDWLVVAGDVGEHMADVEWVLTTLAGRFSTVLWAPGNHELWTPRDDPVQLRGVERYQHIVAVRRRLGVYTPEDPYPVWWGPARPVVVARCSSATTTRSGLMARRPRAKLSTSRHEQASSAPTSTCCTPIRSPPARIGARGGSVVAAVDDHLPAERCLVEDVVDLRSPHAHAAVAGGVGLDQVVRA
jgi:Calcineurin-like phosphoesterase